jgi:type IV secretory pathway TraG/TraD family ATPase VirD4
MKNPRLEFTPLSPAIFIGLAAGALALIMAFLVFFQLIPPTGWNMDREFPASGTWLASYAFSLYRGYIANLSVIAAVKASPVAFISALSTTVSSFDLVGQIGWRGWAVLLISMSASFTAFLVRYALTEPRDGCRHIKGRRLLRGYNALVTLRARLAGAIGTSSQGIEIAPGVCLGRDQEVKHLGLFGTTGSGKSTIIRWICNQILKTSARLLLLDVKGDFTSSFPRKNFVLLSPMDKRGWAWDVAQDIATEQAAREFAARIIKPSHDPLWGDAAREIFTGIIVHLQKISPGTWTWQEVLDAAFLPASELHKLLSRSSPTSSRYIEFENQTGAISKTTASILVTLWSAVVGLIMPLAKAWGKHKPKKRFSVTRWIADDEGMLPRHVIIQSSARYPEMSSAWIGCLIDLAAALAADPTLEESATRRVWMVLDEFPQLGAIHPFVRLMEVGRSKGFACVLAMQDIQQLITAYGESTARTIIGLLGTKVVCRQSAGPSAKFISDELIGKREIECPSTSFARSPTGTTRTDSTHSISTDAVSPEILEGELGVNRWGVKAIILGYKDAHLLTWPLIVWSKRRKAVVPADWTKAE